MTSIKRNRYLYSWVTLSVIDSFYFPLIVFAKFDFHFHNMSVTSCDKFIIAIWNTMEGLRKSSFFYKNSVNIFYILSNLSFSAKITSNWFVVIKKKKIKSLKSTAQRFYKWDAISKTVDPAHIFVGRLELHHIFSHVHTYKWVSETSCRSCLREVAACMHLQIATIWLTLSAWMVRGSVLPSVRRTDVLQKCTRYIYKALLRTAENVFS